MAPANAHQPVTLLDTDTTAAKGPLLVDGTVSFAIRASFAKAGQKKAFRADLKQGDQLAVQYLIVDKRPENTLKNTLLPQLVIISPTGKSLTMKFTERTKFYEPFGKTNYLYLSRYSAPAEPGTYSFTLTSRAKAEVTIAVGDREVAGEVIRGTRPTPTPTPTPSTFYYFFVMSYCDGSGSTIGRSLYDQAINATFEYSTYSCARITDTTSPQSWTIDIDASTYVGNSCGACPAPPPPPPPATLYTQFTDCYGGSWYIMGDYSSGAYISYDVPYNCLLSGFTTYSPTGTEFYNITPGDCGGCP